MDLKKRVLSCAVGVALGVGATAAQAVSVLSWQLIDFDSDGLQSDFSFTTAPSGSSGNIFGTGGETGCSNATDGNNCDAINMVGQAGQGVDTFTTGFNFGGAADFQPMVIDSTAGGATTGAINADIDTSGTLDGTKLTFSSLDFAGVYQGTTFQLLAPDHLTNCTGATAGATGLTCGQVGSAGTDPSLSNPLGYNVQITDLSGTLGAGQYGVVVEWAGTIPGGATNNEAHLRVEGIMSTVPVPAAAWLFASGLIGLVGIARKKTA